MFAVGDVRMGETGRQSSCDVKLTFIVLANLHELKVKPLYVQNFIQYIYLLLCNRNFSSLCFYLYVFVPSWWKLDNVGMMKW